jgi:hypothetical protein
MAKADAPHLRLRIEPTLLARLEKAAEKNDRPLTAEITARLAASFAKDDVMAAVEKLSESVSKKISDTMTVRFEDMVFKQGKWTRDEGKK